MFNLENAIAEWRQQMLAAKISTLALDELENHFREEVERQIRSGANDQEAFEQTVLQIGHSRELKAEFAKDRNLLSLLGRDKFQAIDRIMGTLWLIFSFGGFVLTPRTIIRHVALEHYNLIFLSTMLIMWASYGIGVLGSILLIRRKKAGRWIVGINACLFALLCLSALLRLVPSLNLPVVKIGIFAVYYAITALLMFLPSRSNFRLARQ